MVVDTLRRGPPIVNWAVAGLDPSLDGIAAGALPAGAIIGRNSFGKDSYTLCPVASSVPTLIGIVVIALPRMLPLHKGFDAMSVFDAATKPGAREGGVSMLAQKVTTSRAKTGG